MSNFDQILIALTYLKFFPADVLRYTENSQFLKTLIQGESIQPKEKQVIMKISLTCIRIN